jgi:hypothetical protein
MSLKITIYDSAIPMLDEIAKWSLHSALAALDQSGIELRDRTREAFKQSTRHRWYVKVVNGKRVYKNDGGLVEFGKRFNFKKAGPASMANMIDSFLMPGALTLVVAGMHKSFTPRFYAQEAKAGSTSPIYGQRVGQVLGGSYQILKKLSKGGRFSSQDDKYQRLKENSDTHLSDDADPFYKPRHFVERGRMAAIPQVREIMTSKLESLIYRQINRATVKTQVRTSA